MMTDIKNLFQNGHSLHQAGNLEEAANLYHKILKNEP